jgi:hypothetical protein
MMSRRTLAGTNRKDCSGANRKPRGGGRFYNIRDAVSKSNTALAAIPNRDGMSPSSEDRFIAEAEGRG